jgi:hypothetical protein
MTIVRSVAAMATLVVVGAACNTVGGSGNVVSRQIDVTTFSRLQVSGTFTATVSVGDAEAVTVRIDDNLVDRLDVHVTGATLHIGLRSGTSVTNATLEADVTVRSLSAVDVSGASDVTLTDPLASDAFSIAVSGASRLTGAVEVEEGSMHVSGASDVELSGSATSATVTLSGASSFSAEHLTIDRLEIDLSGASDADVAVTGTLSAGASGASSLRYTGSPTIARSETSGASSIEPSS